MSYGAKCFRVPFLSFKFITNLSGSKGHNCVLTNGKSFTFLHLKDKHVWSTGELVSNSRRAKEIILGICFERILVNSDRSAGLLGGWT